MKVEVLNVPSFGWTAYWSEGCASLLPLAGAGRWAVVSGCECGRCEGENVPSDVVDALRAQFQHVEVREACGA